MDELERVTRVRPDAHASAATKSRDREKLLATIARERLDAPANQQPAAAPRPSTSTTIARLPDTHARGGRAWGAAAAVLVVVAVMTGVLLAADRGSETPDKTPSIQPAVTEPASEPALACGSRLPMEPTIPPGYTGPVHGPSSRSTTPVMPDQLVLHWDSPTGSLEYRWPDDPDAPSTGPIAPATSGDVTYLGASLLPVGQDAVGASQLVFFSFSGLPSECQTLQFTAFENDTARLTDLVVQIMRRPFDNGEPLVAQSVDISARPAVGHCTSPVGEAIPDQGGVAPVDGTFPTPHGALAAFIARYTRVATRGYIEMRLPDGSYAYGVKGPGLETFVTLVDVVPDGSQWRVASWEGTGC